MNTTKTYRTTLNGANWMIIEDKYHTALYINGSKGYYFYGYTFRTVEEAQRFLDKIDARFSKPVESASIEDQPTTTVLPVDTMETKMPNVYCLTL